MMSFVELFNFLSYYVTWWVIIIVGVPIYYVRSISHFVFRWMMISLAYFLLGCAELFIYLYQTVIYYTVFRPRVAFVVINYQ